MRARIRRGLSRRSFSIPVLCYHSWNISGRGYESNDHVALEHDLLTLAERGYRVLPLPTLVEILAGKHPEKLLEGEKLVCLTCDDGNNRDYHGEPAHPSGPAPGFHDILERSRTWLPLYCSGPRAVSFVIASPEARDAITRATAPEHGQWEDTWWSESAAAGILGIANHSWDHLHTAVDVVRQRQNRKGSFFEITTVEDADAQIAEAHSYIQRITDNRILPFFGYPYGHVSPFLRDEYFPARGQQLGIKAAFSTAGRAVDKNSCIWAIPRFVFGFHWKTCEDFIAILDKVEAAGL